MKIGAVIQARSSSVRLPLKVLRDLPYNSGITVIQQIIRRLKKSGRINEIIVATTSEEDDKKIIHIAEDEMVRWYRGSRDNVLERYYLAAKENNLDIIVRITGDCPCIDPEIVDLVIEKHMNAHADYTSNVLVRTFPHGLDTEVFQFNTLERTYHEALNDYEKEHVTHYIYKTNVASFKTNTVEAPSELHAPDIRITLDTEEDYALLCAIFDCLYPVNEIFKTKDIIDIFRKKPWLKLINKNVVQEKLDTSFIEELEEAYKILDTQNLKKIKIFLKKNIKEDYNSQ
jgi:spore coat polysaccharide biosynthesis protein SpsF